MVPNRGDLDCKVAFELVDLIMDNCESRSLLQCSLVCQSWLHRCRPQLFRTVKLNTTSSTLRFASSLGSKYATIPQYIEDLTLELDKQSTEVVSPDPNGERDPKNLRWDEIINLIALRFERKVPKLRRLSVVFRGTKMLSVAGADEMAGETSFILRFASTFEHIIELDLHLLVEEPLALIQFTCSFPDIEVLKIQYMYEDDLEYVEDVEDAEDVKLVQGRAAKWTLPSSLKSLGVSRGPSDYPDMDRMHHYYRWLSRQPPLRLAQLSIYKVIVLVEGADPNIQPYLTQCRELRFLHMGFDTWLITSDERVAVSVGPYDLSPLVQLERLVISIRNIFCDPWDGALLQCIRNMLATLTSRCLQHIVLYIDHGGGYEIREEQLDAIDILLASESFLEVTVELVVPLGYLEIGDGPSDDDLMRARKLFPRCDGQGRLLVAQAPFEARIWHDGDDDDDDGDGEEISWLCKRSFQT